MAAGIYSLTNLAISLIGTLATGPFGPLSVPEAVTLDVSDAARPGYAVQVAALDGTPMGRISSARPMRLDLDRLPSDFINAVLAAEDERFLLHGGVDPEGIAGALRDTLGGTLRGGSTISQQLAKNTMIGNERTLDRKLVEAMAATRLHAGLGGPEILRRYLQSAWYGRGLTGAMQAPQTWFGKTWDQISLAESATLAAMLKGPALYDPWKNPEITRTRRDAILRKMHQLDWIGESELSEAIAEPVRAIAPDTHEASGRWERRAAVADLDDRDLVPETGTVNLTIVPEWQDIAEEVLAEAIRKVSPVRGVAHVDAERLAVIRAMPEPLQLPGDLRATLPSGTPYNSGLILGRGDEGWDLLVAGTGLVESVELSDPHPGYEPKTGDLVPVIRLDDGHWGIRIPTEIEAATVLLDPRNGRILATVGGVDPGLTEFDRTRASRQPGSAIKPFLWLAALGLGFDAGSPVDDIERSYRVGAGEIWRPRNYDHSQSGRISLYSALERSSNLAAAWLIDRLGPEEMALRAETAGVYPQGGMRRRASSALGATETTLRDLVSGYGAIVNDGMPRKPHAIEGITDGFGNAIPEDFRRPGPVASRQSLQDLLGMLRGVIVRGTASDALGKSPVALVGKTGTTQNWRDAWFVGVTPQLAIGVWIGKDDNTPLPNRMAGGSAAAPIAAEILRRAFDAGLIDENGYLDKTMSSSMGWPPELHGSGTRSRPAPASVAPAGSYTPQFVPPPARPAAPVSGAPATGGPSSIDGFWGAVERQAPAGSPNVNTNRNADLLDLMR